MKLSLPLLLGSLAAWIAFTPAPCRAQSEIAPDHFNATNVELFGQPSNAFAENRGPKQKQIGNELKTRYSHAPVKITTPENPGLKVVHLQLNFLGLPIAIDLHKYGELAQWWTRFQALERMWPSGSLVVHLLAS